MRAYDDNENLCQINVDRSEWASELESIDEYRHHRRVSTSMSCAGQLGNLKQRLAPARSDADNHTRRGATL
jgi:hypothetical protein